MIMADFIFLTANMVSMPEKDEELLTILKDLQKNTKTEKGCKVYELHQSKGSPQIFMIYEIWENQECLNAHTSTDFFKKAMEKIQKITAAPAGVVFWNIVKA